MGQFPAMNENGTSTCKTLGLSGGFVCSRAPEVSQPLELRTCRCQELVPEDGWLNCLTSKNAD